jgi:hypothetical protein
MQSFSACIKTSSYQEGNSRLPYGFAAILAESCLTALPPSLRKAALRLCRHPCGKLPYGFAAILAESLWLSVQRDLN